MRLQERTRGVKIGFSTIVKLCSALLVIFLISISQSPVFIITSAAMILVLLSLCPAELILAVLKTGLPAALFSFLIMLPSALWGNLSGAVVIMVKVFLCVTTVRLLSVTTEWALITRALRVFLVPHIFILVLDITVRYIFLLGEMSLGLLYAVKLRSVGGNVDKPASLAGIPGTLFLKSREAAEDVFAAMECRCFTGTYTVGSAMKPSWADCLLFALDGLLLAVFLLVRA